MGRLCIAWEEGEQWKGTSVWVWQGSEPALSLCLSDTSQGHSAYSESEFAEAFQSITYGHESPSAIQTDWNKYAQQIEYLYVEQQSF